MTDCDFQFAVFAGLRAIVRRSLTKQNCAHYHKQDYDSTLCRGDGGHICILYAVRVHAMYNYG